MEPSVDFASLSTSCKASGALLTKLPGLVSFHRRLILDIMSDNEETVDSLLVLVACSHACESQ